MLIQNWDSPDEGLEPATLRLKDWCSTDWANRAHNNNVENIYLTVKVSSRKNVKIKQEKC